MTDYNEQSIKFRSSRPWASPILMPFVSALAFAFLTRVDRIQFRSRFEQGRVGVRNIFSVVSNLRTCSSLSRLRRYASCNEIPELMPPMCGVLWRTCSRLAAVPLFITVVKKCGRMQMPPRIAAGGQFSAGAQQHF